MDYKDKETKGNGFGVTTITGLQSGSIDVRSKGLTDDG